MRAICVFNNKGGVGKTTLTTNVASLLARHHKLRVLVTDCDPQCNSTQLVLGEAQCIRAYYEDEDEGISPLPTILNVVQPLLNGDAGIDGTINRVPGERNRFGVDLMPGHPRFSMIEDILSEAWGNVRGGNLGGLRKTNWFFAFCEAHRSNYDLMLVDVGPSLGSINRSILLGADGFIAPMGCDIFSITGIRNVADWLDKWSTAYERGMEAFHTDNSSRPDYPLRTSPGISNGFFGYTVQQYIAKRIQGERRPTGAYERILKDVPNVVAEALSRYFAPGVDDHRMKLGDVPNMFSLVPMAQSVGAPIHELTSTDGIRGAQYAQQETYVGQLRTLADNLARNVGIARGNSL